ncbi:DUF481 domain-containing protein [Ulvibacterium sp.]|uniref:DUF481 domain-containing protein n=1 Tax=Ulvibacterium sp. TaxID=2665914 RepID=UPI003BAD1E76
MKHCLHRYWRSLYFTLLTFLLVQTGFSQEKAKVKDRIKLFIECRCERSYIRQEINFVDHVRDQGLANINLFIYDIANGSGGRTYKLEFEGVGEYESTLVQRSYDTNVNMTADEVRNGLVTTIKSGLLPYIIQTDLADKVEYKITAEGLAQRQDIDFDDPWNNWIFEIYGEADLDRETSRNEFEYEVGFESDHVTENWRIRTDLQLNQANAEFERNEETFTSERLRYSADGSIVRSLSDHWSAGIFGGARHDTFTNLDFRYYFRPAIEYNIFPYREVLRREIVFAYRIGYFYNYYLEPTIFLKDKEGIFDHSLDIQIRYRQPWGNIFSRLRASTFLNDFSRNRVQLNGRFSIRIFKGLAISFSGDFEIIRDLINLPAGDASLEDVLLQQRQIATDFELGFGFGLSYTFGSAFNNIINNRL